jgi:hypothetical protein
MSEVTGPISTLPGSRHRLPEGTMCDDHPDRPAVARIQGETDSFGSEMNDLCQECLDAERAARNSPEARAGQCDWCKREAADLRDHRDFEEGMSGPVYRVCARCVRREQERLAAEELEDDWDDDIGFPDEPDDMADVSEDDEPPATNSVTTEAHSRPTEPHNG